MICICCKKTREQVWSNTTRFNLDAVTFSSFVNICVQNKKLQSSKTAQFILSLFCDTLLNKSLSRLHIQH